MNFQSVANNAHDGSILSGDEREKYVRENTLFGRNYFAARLPTIAASQCRLCRL